MPNQDPTSHAPTVAQQRSVWRLLEEAARARPEAAALAAPGRPPLSHGDLREFVRETVRVLNSLGINRNDRVATVLPNGPDAALAFLAVAAGATYAPLNPAYREGEFEFYLSDLDARALVVPEGSDSPALAVARRQGVRIVELASASDGPAGLFALKGAAADAPVAGGLAEPGDVALVLHTSGTTSRPKLVPLTQENLCASAAHIARSLRLVPADRCLNVMPLFHIHGLIAAVLAPLAAGGSVFCAPGFLAPRFFEWMDAAEPTWYTAVPTIHQSILQRAARHRGTIARHPLRFVRSSSSALAPATMEQLEAVFDVPVIEAYGMTEAAHQMASNPLPPADRRPGTVGLAAGPDVAVMDERGELLPVGTVGEIVIRGPNVTAGYANNPVANAECFTNGWFRTGDQGWLSEDRYLTLTGRLKEIINRAGEKISPREVDEALLAHPDVYQAVTFALPDPRLGEAVAVAVVPHEGKTVSERDLKHFVAERLAAHKVPQLVQLLEQIPKGPTGKLQRIGLAEKLGLAGAAVPESSPEKPAAADPRDAGKMASIWAEVLGLERVGPDDDFFDLGGDSILAALLLAKVRDELDAEISLVDFVDAPTVSGLLELVSGGRTDGDRPSTPRVTPAPGALHEPFPLTEVQEAYWAGRSGDFQLGNVSTHLYMEVEGTDLDLDRLERAWQRLVDRHAMLRATILPEGKQRILEEVPRYRFERLDLCGRSEDERAAELQAIRLRMSHAVRPYDRWPLFEIGATVLDGRRTRLHMSFDALILDAWSRNHILFREWERLYGSPDLALPPLEITFRDYVLAERAQRDTDEVRRARDYWESRLAQLPPAPELPLAVNPDRVTSPKFLRRVERVDPAAWARVKKRAAKSRLTSAGALITAFAEVLRTWSHHPRFTLNLTTFNRQPYHPQVNDVLGDFTSVSLLEVDASARESFESLAARLQKQLWRDLDHGAMSGIEVLRRLAAGRGGAPRALMPVVLTSAVARGGAETSHAWMGDLVYSVAQTPQVWLDLQTFEEGGGLTIYWNEVEELFPQGMMQDAFEAFAGRVRDLADDPEGWNRSPRRAALVPPPHLEERDRANSTRKPVPDGLLHAAFEERARLQPEHPAVITPKRTVTYGELLSTSRRIAHLLRDRGAKPNTLVAVVTEKDWEQVPAVLGVLQSGAAYLPIDSTMPTERLHHLLLHGEVDLVVTQGCVDPVVEWPPGVERITVNEPQLDGVADAPLDPAQEPADLAYVIYTSGSTGLPKGVMIDHRAAWNTIHVLNRRFEILPEDRVFAISALSFDLSVYDIFGTLAAGGTIVMPDVSGLRDPAHWAERIERERVTIWNSVPALMELLAEATAADRGDALRSLRLVLLSGDWIPLALPDRIRKRADARVVSLGGATEASIWSIFHPIGKVDRAWKSIPYGRPLDNQTLHVLDDALEPRPEWVPGQLHIGGAGLARGYWRDAERTAESFLTHPTTGERIYRTGDLGRYLPGGEIEFLGREDSQVKVQGFRIELAEVEHALQQHPVVRAGVVQLGGEPRGKRFLIAYVVPESAAAVPTDELRDFLKNKLPDYMVPTQFVTLPELPLTANGKVDRQALPAPAAAQARPRAADTGTARVDRVAAVVCKVMEIESLEPSANLLHLGATSIDMIRIANLLERERGFRPSMDEFYADPSANGLAVLYSRQVPRAAAPEPERPIAAPAAAPPSRPFIDDPLRREEFKKTQPGLRRDVEPRPTVALDPDEVEPRPFLERRSVRRFGLKPIPVERVGRLLSCLRQVRDDDDQPKYRYGSAGALYPVQTYVYVKPGRVQGLAAGIYYHHPVEHRLVTLTPKVEIDPNVYDRLVNRPIFEESALAIFLIADLDAITPMYADRSLHLSTLEAGLMTQLLEEAGPPLGLGLCQIGSLEFDMIRHFFALRDGHVLLHSLLAGPIETGSDDEDESARLLRRVRELSPDEARALLEVHRDDPGESS